MMICLLCSNLLEPLSERESSSARTRYRNRSPQQLAALLLRFRVSRSSYPVAPLSPCCLIRLRRRRHFPHRFLPSLIFLSSFVCHFYRKLEKDICIKNSFNFVYRLRREGTSFPLPSTLYHLSSYFNHPSRFASFLRDADFM